LNQPTVFVRRGSGMHERPPLPEEEHRGAVPMHGDGKHLLFCRSERARCCHAGAPSLQTRMAAGIAA
jgi:hypothetical protein